jgi:hypothetical protein
MEERPGGFGYMAAPGGAARESRLLEDLQIGDDVIHFLTMHDFNDLARAWTVG